MIQIDLGQYDGYTYCIHATPVIWLNVCFMDVLSIQHIQNLYY